jgi:hypothetical protein
MFEYKKCYDMYDTKIINKVQFDISRYHKYKEIINFEEDVSVREAIKTVEEYLSTEISEDYFNKIKNDHYEEYKYTDFKYRGDVLFKCIFLDIVDINNGLLTLNVGS